MTELLISEAQNAPLPQAFAPSKLPTLLDSQRACSRAGSRCGSHPSNHAGSLSGGSRPGSRPGSDLGSSGKAWEPSGSSPTPHRSTARSDSASPLPAPRFAFHNSRSGSRKASRKFSRERLENGSLSTALHCAGKTAVTEKSAEPNKGWLVSAVESAVADRPSFSDQDSDDSISDIDAAEAMKDMMSEGGHSDLCPSQRTSFMNAFRTSGVGDRPSFPNKFRISGDRISNTFWNSGDRCSNSSFKRDSQGESVASMGSAGSSGLDFSDHEGVFSRQLSNSLQSPSNRCEFRRLPRLTNPESIRGHLVASPRCLLAEARQRAARLNISKHKFVSAPAAMENAEASATACASSEPCDNKQPPESNASETASASADAKPQAADGRSSSKQALDVRSSSKASTAVPDGRSPSKRAPDATYPSKHAPDGLSQSKRPGSARASKYEKKPKSDEVEEVVDKKPVSPTRPPGSREGKRRTHRFRGRAFLNDSQHTTSETDANTSLDDL